ncbi:diguanylate cyclase domain-containing protein [Fictibacillus iocasae]|uniref:Diguanylate cyclase domain-containing protein n=1 Tax=Fictibacillus iocasae TaxID=2715437 RepID=A0ABW2NTB6_9BACL
MNVPFRLSLRARSTISTVMIVSVLTLLLSVAIGRYTSEELKSEIGNSVAQNAYQTSDKLDSFMWARTEEVKMLSQLSDLHQLKDKQRIKGLLENLKEGIPFYSWIGYLDTKGNVLVSTGGILEGKNISQRPVFMEGLQGPFIGDVHDAVLLAKLLPQSSTSNGPLRFVDISMPVYGESGEKTGVLATHLSWEWANDVERSILKPVDKSKKIEVFVISERDQAVVLGSKDLIGKKLRIKSVKQAEKGKNSWTMETWPDGKKYMTGYVKGSGYMDYEGLGWTVLVRQPADIAFAPVNDLQQFIMMTGLLCALVFAVIAWFLAGRVSQPLGSISSAALQLKNGHNVAIPEPKGITEIEILSASLKELIHSLSATEKELDKMENIAQHDSLTGLPNRLALDDFIATAAKQAVQDDQPVSFLYIDLDDFKPVNDTYGHQTGDLLLKQVAQRIQRCIRSGDFAARLGGDEFAVILPHTGTQYQAEARKIAERIVKDLHKPFTLGDVIVTIGCSIGGAVWRDAKENPSNVLRLADEALYKAKRNGKNRAAI